MRGYAQDCSNPVNLVLIGPPGARPLVNFYRKRSTFCAVDGTLSPEHVAAQIELAIGTARENVSA